jgi:hypothetical protein
MPDELPLEDAETEPHPELPLEEEALDEDVTGNAGHAPPKDGVA